MQLGPSIHFSAVQYNKRITNYKITKEQDKAENLAFTNITQKALSFFVLHPVLTWSNYKLDDRFVLYI